MSSIPSTPSSCEARALLRLLQLFDSQFPVGAFAHSGGIETYAASGAGLPEMREVLDAQIALGWGRGDLAAAYLAWQAAPDSARLHQLSARVHALKVIPASRDTSVRLGGRTLSLVRRLYPSLTKHFDVAPPHHAVVVGAVARAFGLEATPMLLAFAQSLAQGTLAAATRCMPIAPAQAQALLVEAHGAIVEACARVEADPEGSLFSSTPALDIRAHHQLFLRTRLFQS
jgi:urease accessory protein